MKKRKKLASAAASGLLLLGLTLPAAAVTTSVGGGSWSYGITYKDGKQHTVYSNYYHPSVFHRASTINGWGRHSCTHTRAGQTAYNSQDANPKVTDKSYWARTAC